MAVAWRLLLSFPYSIPRHLRRLRVADDFLREADHLLVASLGDFVQLVDDLLGLDAVEDAANSLGLGRAVIREIVAHVGMMEARRAREAGPVRKGNGGRAVGRAHLPRER